MAKINVTLGAREITEHFAAGEHARAFQRAMIAEHLPAFLARFGGFMPVYDMAGNPDNPAALAATAARKVRLAARAAAATAAREASMAARIATAAALSASLYYAADMIETSGHGYYDGDGQDDPSENTMLFSHR